MLATGDDHPVALATEFGKGRGFTLLLGHSPAFMEPPGFQTLLCRGAEWAATGQVAPRDVLTPLAGYRCGPNRAILLEVAYLAQTAPREMAPQLAAMLDADATLDGKKFVCEQLGLIGTAAEVPSLAKQLSNPELALAARSALERIPAAESLAALRAALPGATGGLRQGSSTRSAPAGTPWPCRSWPDCCRTRPRRHRRHRDAGSVGGVASRAAAARRCVVTMRQLQLGDVAVLEKLWAAEQPKAIRVAAFLGRVDALGDQGGGAVLAALSGNDPALQAAAIRTVRGAAVVQAAAAAMGPFFPGLAGAPAGRVGRSGEIAALPAVTQAVASPDPAVRRAAIAALSARSETPPRCRCCWDYSNGPSRKTAR